MSSTLSGMGSMICGGTERLAATEAARMLRRYGANLIVLNACETATGTWAGLAPALVRAEIPAVVAMQWPIEDQAAIRFSRSFYRTLSMGRTIDECVAEGRLGASAAHSDPNDWAAPVLFLRSLSGQLWMSSMAKAQEPPRPMPLPDPRKRLPDVETMARATPDGNGSLFKSRGPLLASDDADRIVERPEMRRALRIAQQPSVTQYVAFLGARQTGKTTMLFYLRQVLKEQYPCVFIDLSVLTSQDERACFRYVAFRLINEFTELMGDELDLPESQVIEGSPDFCQFLRDLAHALPMERVVVLIDEVGALAPAVSNGFFSTLRSVFTEGRGDDRDLARYLFVFSGAVDLYALTSGSHSPLNICEKLYLRDFERVDVARIVRRFDQIGVSVAKGTSDKVFELAGGHPYLTQQLCVLMEQEHTTQVTPESVEAAAEAILVEDDNIRHIIRELERRPQAQRRLRSILLEEQQIPFSRNDPSLAALEMIGVIRGTQPVQVRNKLYEKALHTYLESRQVSTPRLLGLRADDDMLPGDPGAKYERLLLLRQQAMENTGMFRRSSAWQNYAAALFSLVPALSVYPGVHTHTNQLDIVLAVNSAAPGSSYWQPYEPAILVECGDAKSPVEQRRSAAIRHASAHNITLVFVMTTSLGEPHSASKESGASGDVCYVCLDDAEISELAAKRRDLDEYLRARVLNARLRSV